MKPHMHMLVAHATPARRRGGGFTLIEVLVVVGVIVLLMAILIPAIGRSRENARNGAARQFMGSLATALHGYHADHGVFPPQIPYGSFGASEGPEVFAQGLLGYLSAADDGADGLGFRLRANIGRVHGPYGPAVHGGETEYGNFKGGWVLSLKPGTPPPARYAYQDYRSSDTIMRKVFYFRAVPPQVKGVARNITQVFAPFTPTAQAPTPDDDPTFTGYFASNGYSPDPAGGDASFFGLIGSKGNALSQASGVEAVLGRDSFLLVSPGRNGTYFDADDIVVVR